ncbi:hypothetical protein Patl1_23621 [Pistacia atlantica]|uniref:Uncharacterized protein n=1 Tax=Pistacia atlantica TaxID=434234 RepID=A0ACC0ZWP4_9ROSI|nr:hypothetical protein Patl1_23621 [Pistacia atlantica]
MTSEHQYISLKDEGDRIIVFERGNLVFVFNFHWSNSDSDCRISCLKPEKYKEGWYDGRPRSFLVYAPSRTVVCALVDNELEPQVKDELEPAPIEKELEPAQLENKLESAKD